MVYPALLPLSAQTSAASRLNWPTLRRFKWTRPFRRMTKSGFCACGITFQLASNQCSWLETVRVRSSSDCCWWRHTVEESYVQSCTKEIRYLINKRVIMKQSNGKVEAVAQRYCKVKTPLVEPECTGLSSGVQGRGKWQRKEMEHQNKGIYK